MPPQLTVVEHAVLADRLTVLRDRNTAFPDFRHALFECSAILAVEAARTLRLRRHRRSRHRSSPRAARACPSRSWSCRCCAPASGWSTDSCACCPTRASAISAWPATRRRTRRSTTTRGCRPGMAESHVFLLDPMLATGGSAVNALQHLKDAGAGHLELVCLVSAPEGIEAVTRSAPRRQDLDGRRRPRARSRTPTSGPVWATPATACSARSDRRSGRRRRASGNTDLGQLASQV